MYLIYAWDRYKLSSIQYFLVILFLKYLACYTVIYVGKLMRVHQTCIDLHSICESTNSADELKIN